MEEIVIRKEEVDEFQELRWKTVLREITQPEIQLSEISSGLKFEKVFQNLEEEWKSLFLQYQVDLTFHNYIFTKDFPEDLSRVTAFDISGERAVMGVSQSSEESITNVFAPLISDVASDTLIEYLERRFVSSLKKSCLLNHLDFSYIGEDEQETEVVIALCLKLQIVNNTIELWIGLSKKIVEELFNLLNPTTAKTDNLLVSVSLVDMTISTANLLDISKKSSIVDLKLNKANIVKIIIGDKFLAEAELLLLNDKFVFQVKNIINKLIEIPENSSYLYYEIAKVNIPRNRLNKLRQKDILILTDTLISDNPAIIVNGEEVSNAVIGEINGRIVAKTV